MTAHVGVVKPAAFAVETYRRPKAGVLASGTTECATPGELARSANECATPGELARSANECARRAATRNPESSLRGAQKLKSEPGRLRRANLIDAQEPLSAQGLLNADGGMGLFEELLAAINEVYADERRRWMNDEDR